MDHLLAAFQRACSPALYQAASSPVTILPGTYSRIEERLQLFEDMFRNLEMGYAYENISYALLCLNHFLGSLLFLNQYQLIRRTGAHQENIMEPARHFLRENLEKKRPLNDLARFLNYSPSHFSMIFKKTHRLCPHPLFYSAQDATGLSVARPERYENQPDCRQTRI
jgi:AraC-like DNA-binding protein